MTIFEKLKLFVWLFKEMKKMEKLNALLGKLDGLKSYLGLLGVVGYYGAIAYGVTPPEAVLTTSYGLLGVGIVHKLDKATGVIRKVIPVLGSILAMFDKKKEEEKK